MTDLSPAAQAVLDAAHYAANKVILFGSGDESPAPMCVAAALRAAASQLTSAKSSDALRAIAAELEDQ